MRWIVRLLAAVVVFVVILAAGVMLVPTGRIAALAAKQFQEATGRSLTLVGDPRPTLWPVLGVRTGAIAIANADWSGSGPMLEAEGLVIGLKTAALLRGEVAIDELVLDRPTIRLERNASGTGNWEIGRAAPAAPGPAAAPAGAAAPAPAFAIDRARIAGGTLSFTDRASGTALALADLDLDAALPRFSGPATLTGSAVMNGTPVTLDARLGSFADALAGRLSALDLRPAARGLPAIWTSRSAPGRGWWRG
jgi:AsmA protein